MKKGKLLITLLLALLMVFSICACSDSDSTSTTNSSNSDSAQQDITLKSAIVYDFLQGEGTTVLRSNEEQKAYIGMRLIADDEISTDSESKTYLRIDDTKNILMDIDTIMYLEEYNANSLVLTLKEGEFFFDVTEKLNSNEEMSFKIANTTMSIRGTSGVGTLKNNKANYQIYSGKGEIKAITENNKEISVSLFPNTKVSFDVTDEGYVKEDTVEVSIVANKDVPELLNNYASENEDYIEELKEENWGELSEGSMVPPTSAKFNPLTQSGDYTGWVQKADGTWYFSNENYEKGIAAQEAKKTEKVNNTASNLKSIVEVQNEDPAPYIPAPVTPTYPDKSSIDTKSYQYPYSGEDITLNVDGFDANTMSIENNVQKDIGFYKAVIKPKGQWSDGTTDSIEIDWYIAEPVNLSIENDGYYYSGSPSSPSFICETEGVVSTLLYRLKDSEDNYTSAIPKVTYPGNYIYQVISADPLIFLNNTEFTYSVIADTVTVEARIEEDNNQISITPYACATINGQTVYYSPADDFDLRIYQISSDLNFTSVSLPLAPTTSSEYIAIPVQKKSINNLSIQYTIFDVIVDSTGIHLNNESVYSQPLYANNYSPDGYSTCDILQVDINNDTKMEEFIILSVYGTNAKVMSTSPINDESTDIRFRNNSSGTFGYGGSDLDTYLNETYYNSIDKRITIVQQTSIKESVYTNTETNAYSKVESDVVVGDRYVVAPSVEDLENIFHWNLTSEQVTYNVLFGSNSGTVALRTIFDGYWNFTDNQTGIPGIIVISKPNGSWSLNIAGSGTTSLAVYPEFIIDLSSLEKNNIQYTVTPYSYGVPLESNAANTPAD